MNEFATPELATPTFATPTYVTRSSSMTRLLRVSLTLLFMASACGGNYAQKTSPAGSSAPAHESMSEDGFSGRSYSEDPREHITQLFDEIGTMRQERGFAREPGAGAVRLHDDAPAPQSADTESVTARAATPVCESTCKLQANICGNASKICALAGDLADTEWADWADEKCNSGKVSCEEAKTQCDECDG